MESSNVCKKAALIFFIIIFVGGFFLAFNEARELASYYYEFNYFVFWKILLTTWTGGSFIVIVTYALGEIIHNLNDINQNTKQLLSYKNNGEE